MESRIGLQPLSPTVMDAAASSAAIERQMSAFEAFLSELIGEAAAEGEVRDLAGFLIAAWHGSLLRRKVKRSLVALRQFRRSLDR